MRNAYSWATLSRSTSTSKDADTAKAQEFKQDGNKAFQDKLYNQAVESYSKALEAGGETTRAMLSNWALCVLEIHNFGDCGGDSSFLAG